MQNSHTIVSWNSHHKQRKRIKKIPGTFTRGTLFFLLVIEIVENKSVEYVRTYKEGSLYTTINETWTNAWIHVYTSKCICVGICKSTYLTLKCNWHSCYCWWLWFVLFFFFVFLCFCQILYDAKCLWVSVRACVN